MNEQNEGSIQIGQALHTMNDSTSEVRIASIEMSEGNKLILVQVIKLQQIAEDMQASMVNMSCGVERINNTGLALTKISDDMNNSINDIGNQVDLFKI